MLMLKVLGNALEHIIRPPRGEEKEPKKKRAHYASSLGHLGRRTERWAWAAPPSPPFFFRGGDLPLILVGKCLGAKQKRASVFSVRQSRGLPPWFLKHGNFLPRKKEEQK